MTIINYISERTQKLFHLSQVWLLLAVVISSGVLLFRPLSAAAEDAQDSGGFSVKAILPENQRDKEVTYYDLRVKPGDEQDLELELYNSTKEPQQLSVAINPGITNNNGLIDYSTRDKNYSYDPSLTMPLQKIATTTEKVTVPAMNKVTTKIHLKVPNEAFKGMILGGIYVSSLEEAKDTKKDTGGGMQIKNKVVYSIGMKLTENDDPVEADLQYEKGSTKASQEAGRNLVQSKIRNVAPVNLDDISYHAKIYAGESKEVLHEQAVTGYRMAPNSYFEYQVPWNNEPFKAGKYRITLSAESKATGQKWNWEDTFTIEAKEAKKLNDKAVDLEQTTNWWLYALIGAGVFILILLLILAIILFKRRKEKKKREAERKQKQKRKKKQAAQAKKRKEHPTKEGDES